MEVGWEGDGVARAGPGAGLEGGEAAFEFGDLAAQVDDRPRLADQFFVPVDGVAGRTIRRSNSYFWRSRNFFCVSLRYPSDAINRRCSSQSKGTVARQMDSSDTARGSRPS